MFMGYEWQGAGLDGDHNVFFLENGEKQEHPMRYQELVEAYKGKPVSEFPIMWLISWAPEERTGKPTMRNFPHLQRFIPAMAAVKMMTVR